MKSPKILPLVLVALISSVAAWLIFSNMLREKPGFASSPDEVSKNSESRPDDSGAVAMVPIFKKRQVKEPKYPDAEWARPGFVYSPTTKTIVDVRDLPTGTLVQDPSVPIENRAFFRVPPLDP